jgi:hypothetical protein
VLGAFRWLLERLAKLFRPWPNSPSHSCTIDQHPTSSITRKVGVGFRWLSELPAVLFRPRRPRSGLEACVLPPEIFLMIATHLPNPSIISLALTCRTLYGLCFPQCPNLNEAEKEELLLFLEKDIATLYFCHLRAKLHRWSKSWGRYINGPVNDDLPCKRLFVRYCFDWLNFCYFPYHHARLVMNRHFYGAAHGLPLQRCEGRQWLQHPFSRVTDYVSLRARIVDDKLLFRSVRNLSHSRGNFKALRSYIDSTSCHVCEHLSPERGRPDIGRLQLPEMAMDNLTSDHPTPHNDSVRSCPICLTDYCISIWQDRKGCFIKIFTYRQLGDCRSPFDWNWRIMRGLQLEFEKPRERTLERPGIVRDRWHKADGLEGQTQCEWVQLPRRLFQQYCGPYYYSTTVDLTNNQPSNDRSLISCV